MINEEILKILDLKFKDVIIQNKRVTKLNLRSFGKRYPSLMPFVAEQSLVDRNTVAQESDIIKIAVDEKSRIEKKFWNQISHDIEEELDFGETDDCYKLLNSSLQIYVKHRERVLSQLKKLIELFDEDGEYKPELESTVHELFIKRGITLDNSENINHLHNLWILDDKFTIFSGNFKARSTKNGQSLTDVYIWADDERRTRQVLLLELKSTTKAHNSGSREEGMIAQIKRYAEDFYINPTKALNWQVNTAIVQFIGIIVARKADIKKEITSRHTSGSYERIPFLEESYYCNDHFYINNDPDMKIPIRIELYSFEDIYDLASSRNAVFFKLLKQEFDVIESDE